MNLKLKQTYLHSVEFRKHDILKHLKNVPKQVRE